MSTTRRNFLATAGSFALVAAGMGAARAVMGPNDKFDLVIKGGDVLDPSQSLRGERDIGIRYGVIMSSAIPSEKNSCSGSPLMLVNGRTATDGLLSRKIVAGQPY